MIALKKNGTFIWQIDNAIHETRNSVYCPRITVALFSPQLKIQGYP